MGSLVSTTAPASSPQGQPPATAAPPKRRHWLVRAARAAANWLLINLTVGAFGLWLAGQVFRERYHATGLCLFIPSALVACSLLVAAVLAWLCTCRWTARAAALLAIGPLVVFLGVENRWWRRAHQAGSGETLRLVHWNVWAGRRGWDKIAAELKAQEADIYVLSEAFSAEGVRAVLDELGPGYTVDRAHNMVVIVRGRVARLDALRRKGRAYVFLCTVGEADLTVLVGDLPSKPIIHRAPFLRLIRELIADTQREIDETQPDFVVGDFNAPRRSRLLSTLPEGFAHAYNQAGRGWSYTWPARFPLWAIDQCIVGPRVQALRYDLVTTRLSDHRMQVLDFAVREEDPSE